MDHIFCADCSCRVKRVHGIRVGHWKSLANGHVDDEDSISVEKSRGKRNSIKKNFDPVSTLNCA